MPNPLKWISARIPHDIIHNSGGKLAMIFHHHWWDNLRGIVKMFPKHALAANDTILVKIVKWVMDRKQSLESPLNTPK